MGQRFAKPPAQAGPAMIADHAAKIKRLEGSRDALVSSVNKIGPQAAAAQTAANAAKTEADGINTRLGSANLAFLGGLTEIPHIANESGRGSHSGIGTIGGTPTAAEYNALNTAYNNTCDLLNDLVSKYNSLLDELQAGGYMY